MKPIRIAVAVLLLFGVSCARTEKKASPPAESGTEAPKPAPEFALKNASGATVKLSDYRGKVVLLNFWGTWCPPCKVEIPWFIDLQQQFGPKGFTVLGVAMHEDNGWKDVTPFAADRHINYPIILGDDSLDATYGGLMIFPTTYLIDRSGNIVSTHEGIGIGKDGLAKLIEPLLK